MLPNFAELLETVQTTVGGWIGFLIRPSTFVQFGILVAIFAFSMLLARKIEPPLEAKARKLKINADTKRVLFSFLQRFEWVLSRNVRFCAVQEILVAQLSDALSQYRTDEQ